MQEHRTFVFLDLGYHSIVFSNFIHYPHFFPRSICLECSVPTFHPDVSVFHNMMCFLETTNKRFILFDPIFQSASFDWVTKPLLLRVIFEMDVLISAILLILQFLCFFSLLLLLSIILAWFILFHDLMVGFIFLFSQKSAASIFCRDSLVLINSFSLFLLLEVFFFNFSFNYDRQLC